MKKYITGILAVIIAVGAAAFTTKVQNSDMVTFVYNPPSTDNYTQPNVQNKLYWSPGSECGSGENRACSFQVSLEDTQSSGTELGPNVSITAAEGQVSGKYLVTGGNNISGIHNRN